MSGVLVGLVDGGVTADLRAYVAEDSGFTLGQGDAVEQNRATEDAIGHGASIARTILAAAPAASIVNAQVFHDSISAPPAVIAAALGWVVERGARVVNLSFGVRQDREVLRLACAAARATGAILLAAAPARGPRVFPASYPGVIRISGDARCAPGEVSLLASAQADFGARPATVDGRVRGASAAVAWLTGRVAALLAERPAADAASVTGFLESIAQYRGPERRAADLSSGRSSPALGDDGIE
ncbi:MAG: S8 family serine peptidase [Candidatus Binatia bacterium]